MLLGAALRDRWWHFGFGWGITVYRCMAWMEIGVENMYWFGFKQKGGAAIPCGPFTEREVNIERQRAKAKDADVSVWFIADNSDDAQVKADYHMREVKQP